MSVNRLAGTTSPYLLQHAHNPVHWWPWCDEALELARREDRPILLSIGYSACHWCHVMAHESFEDAATAELMNRLFVNIKVDREERPDLDRIYQSAHQLLARRPGGWPLTVFLTPDDRLPFFAGTYFPPRPRHGLPGFGDLLVRIEAVYRAQPAAVREQNQAMREALSSLNPAPARPQAMNADPLEQARHQLGAAFDATFGGFGQAPKFPHPSDLELLLRRWRRAAAAGRPDPQALAMPQLTLTRMIEGGINDQLGGGFCRYSVDACWEIPHFEKMLYDNGPLLALCCDAWQATGQALFRTAAAETAEWMMREMQAPGGGFFASLDADSEGEEGRFYVWTREQVQEVLQGDDYALFAARYGLDAAPNFEGRWHLRVARDLESLARDRDRTPEELARRLDASRARLLAARAGRARPACDDKVLTAWNALAIKGMARAARVLGRDDCLASARRGVDFLRSDLWRGGRLLASWRGGVARLPAYLDDYAFLLDALLELLQAGWRRKDLELATALAETLLEHFQDPAGGFFFTADDHEDLIHRPKPLSDEAMPAGNGVAALALARLGHLLGEARYLEAAEATLRLAWPYLQQYPHAHASLLMALEEWLDPGETLVVRAPAGKLPEWQARLPSSYAPGRLALWIPDGEAGLPGLLGERRPRTGGVAYLCRGPQCLAPAESPHELAKLLGG